MSSRPPRKRFGQHFLHDPAILRRVLDAVDPRPGEALVEVGPGRGALTVPLLERCGELDAIEVDRDLAAALPAQAPAGTTLRLHGRDVLGFDFAALAAERGSALRVVGNLPYNISTPLLFHLLETAASIRDMHFMLQREVVDRMAAGPGDPDYGRLSVMITWRCRVERLFRIGAGAFQPPPRVESAFVRLVPHTEPPFRVDDPVLFGRLVSEAFSRRRKTLRNALAHRLSAEAIAATGIDPALRPERLSPADFARLASVATEANRAERKRR